MNENTARQHLTVLAALYIGFSAVFALAGILVMVILPTIAIYSDDPQAVPVLSTIGVLVGMFLLVTAVPGIIAGIGLLRRRRWARILAMILAAVYALNVPIGTLLAVYALWVLVQDATERLFEPLPAGPGL